MTLGAWNFDVDRYLNHIVPPPPWRHLPYPVAWFFGYRKGKPNDIGNLRPIFWAFIGIFCAILIIEVVSLHVPSFQDHNAPLIVGSFGAAAVLEFYSIEAPLAQPRNAILGQAIATIVGVAVCKLFLLSDDFHSIRWIGGALACAAATALMAITKTVHPPAGATALLAVTNDQIVQMGWFLVPVMLLGCGLMLCVALLVNNIERRFPMYWWTPENLTSVRERPMFQRRRTLDEEQPEEEGEEKEDQVKEPATGGNGGAAKGAAAEETAGAEKKKTTPLNEVIIRPGLVIVPEHMYVTQEEQQFLETLSERI